ncbi:hypothetical protein [Lentzea sp. CA-135723]|uniref:hypothetical protein n=1 Tax=Lentzea sp. CA-135723 TaxID=3239950 RepID=UPI003D91EA65
MLARALAGTATAVALWVWGARLFVPPESTWLNGRAVTASAWEAAAWSLCVVVAAALVPLVVRPARRPRPVSDWGVPVGAGLVTGAAGCWDLADVYDGLRPMGIAEHVARSGDASWGWFAGEPVRSLVAGAVAVVVVVFWAWWRRWWELVAIAAVAAVALSVAAAVLGDTGGGAVLTSSPYDAAGFFWHQVAITVVAGVALTAGTLVSTWSTRLRRPPRPSR